jgi:hypothetical protein
MDRARRSVIRRFVGIFDRFLGRPANSGASLAIADIMRAFQNCSHNNSGVELLSAWPELFQYLATNGRLLATANP